MCGLPSTRLFSILRHIRWPYLPAQCKCVHLLWWERAAILTEQSSVHPAFCRTAVKVRQWWLCEQPRYFECVSETKVRAHVKLAQLCFHTRKGFKRERERERESERERERERECAFIPEALSSSTTMNTVSSLLMHTHEQKHTSV